MDPCLKFFIGMSPFSIKISLFFKKFCKKSVSFKKNNGEICENNDDFCGNIEIVFVYDLKTRKHYLNK